MTVMLLWSESLLLICVTCAGCSRAAAESQGSGEEGAADGGALVSVGGVAGGHRGEAGRSQPLCWRGTAEAAPGGGGGRGQSDGLWNYLHVYT